MPTVIRKCDCISKYQDEVYGKGNRLHNVGDCKVWCTVCNKMTRTEKALVKGKKKGA